MKKKNVTRPVFTSARVVSTRKRSGPAPACIDGGNSSAAAMQQEQAANQDPVATICRVLFGFSPEDQNHVLRECLKRVKTARLEEIERLNKEKYQVGEALDRRQKTLAEFNDITSGL